MFILSFIMVVIIGGFCRQERHRRQGHRKEDCALHCIAERREKLLGDVCGRDARRDVYTVIFCMCFFMVVIVVLGGEGGGGVTHTCSHMRHPFMLGCSIQVGRLYNPKSYLFIFFKKKKSNNYHSIHTHTQFNSQSTRLGNEHPNDLQCIHKRSNTSHDAV